MVIIPTTKAELYGELQKLVCNLWNTRKLVIGKITNTNVCIVRSCTVRRVCMQSERVCELENYTSSYSCVCIYTYVHNRCVLIYTS